MNGFKSLVSTIKMDLTVFERDTQNISLHPASAYIAGDAGSERALNDNRPVQTDHILRDIAAEFELTKAPSGCKNVAKINPKSLKASF